MYEIAHSKSFFIRRLRYHTALKILSALILVGIDCLCLPSGDRPKINDVSVTVSSQGDLQKYWKVGNAEFDDSLLGSDGRFEISNVSSDPIERAAFYGEYFDFAGRLCFTLFFSLDRNLQNETSKIKTGERRTLYFPAYGLSPAAQPKELRLYLVRQQPSVEKEEVSEPHRAIQSPVVLDDTASSLEWEKVWLQKELDAVSEPILDLAMVHVVVDTDGAIQRVELLNAVSPEVQSWFRIFTAHLRFMAARSNGTPGTSTTLLLVRAVLTPKGLADRSFSAQESTWVKDYVQRAGGTQLPPVNTVRLEPDPSGLPAIVQFATDNNTLPRRLVEYPEVPTPGFFAHNGVGNYWSGGNAEEMQSLEIMNSTSRRSPIH